MARIAAVHSYRGGSGKSQTAANVALLLAGQGLRVGLVDTDIQTPGLHVLFGRQLGVIPFGLSDYLVAACEIDQAVYDVSAAVSVGNGDRGALYLVPSRADPATIVQVATLGYDIALLNVGLQRLNHDLDLDVMLLDTHPGVNSETAVALALADILVVVVRPDRQEFEGAEVAQLVSRRSPCNRTVVVVNMVPEAFRDETVERVALEVYQGDLTVLLPYAPELAVLAGSEPFVLRHGDHPITALFQQVTDGLGLDLPDPC